MIDSHCHIHYSNNLIEDYNLIIQNGIKKLLCIFDIEDFDNKMEEWNFLVQQKETLLSIGIHPNKINNIHRLKDFTQKYANNIVALGETGIDLHYSSNLSEQIESLHLHMDLCKQYNKTLIVHSRDVDIDIILNEIKQYNIRYVFHSFNYGLNEAKKLLNHGGMISFSGMLTFKSCEYLREVCEYVPITSILTETDSPFLAPVPMRGRTNFQHYVKYVYELISNIKNININELYNIIDINFNKTFIIN